MLANPSSNLDADKSRRAAVQAQVDAYNVQLALLCGATPNCTFDGNAVAGTAFVASDISTRDYFHPSLAGQTKLAGIAWTAAKWGK